MQERSTMYFIKTILKEGKWFFLLPGIICFYFIIDALFFGASWSSLDSFVVCICLIIMGYTLFFLRPPKNFPTQDSSCIYASADGYIFSVEENVECPYMPGETYNKVIIFMHIASMHWNQSPISGEITETKLIPGKFRNIFHAERNWKENEHQVIIIENKENNTRVMIGMVAGLIARRIRFFRKEKESLKQGDILGLIRYGSANILYFPTDYKIVVSLKEKSRAGKTIIAKK